ncbi:conserved Plasmodium protein, unknown function [Plasmodium gaboni]|uniref:Nucleolar complex-associated protein 3 N-terminal domain-containing protein n=1 Tax=Plasmodium gaboni TaxID=647221 RepID=A0ABY1UV25_9APIC|nr:conserved Plasmodium protein, unknown function [Plasmodium gaboni]
MDLKKNIKKNKENENVKDPVEHSCEEEPRRFNQEVSASIRRENFSLPKIQKNGLLSYEKENESFEDEDSESNTNESRKKKKEILNLKKLIENMEKRNRFDRQSTDARNNALEQEIKRISSMMNYYKDFDILIATICNSILGDPNAHVEKLELLFFIFYESFKRKKDILYIRLNNNLYELRRMNDKMEHENENLNNTNDNNQESHDQHNEKSLKEKCRYFSDLNILSCISICNVLKSITPSYKIIVSEGSNEMNDKKDNDSHGNNNMHTNKKSTNPTKNYSKLIKNVNKVEKMIVNFFRRFCRLLRENISSNLIVFVNLLCEIVGVNLYLSREENLFEYLVIYSNLTVYSKKKFNNNINILNNANVLKNIKKFKLLCANCVVQIIEIIKNDNNLSFTLNLVDCFSNMFFKNEKYITSTLLKIFTNIDIKEKKLNARIFENQSSNTHMDNNKELNAKTNISGDIKIIEKNVEKILDRLFVIYMCVLKEFDKYSHKILKCSLLAISKYSMYIDKFIMDDILIEIRDLSVIKIIPSTLRIMCIIVYLEIYNSINDYIYVDCTWVGNTILELLDFSCIPTFYSFTPDYKIKRGNNNWNNQFLDNSDDESINSELENFMKYDEFKFNTDSDDIERKMNKGIENEKRLYQKFKYCMKVIKAIDLLLKTKSFTINYNNFKSSSSDLLYKIIYQLFNIVVHIDFEIGMILLDFLSHIFTTYPLIKCICEQEGIVVSYMDKNFSVFYHNVLLHSSFFKELSCEALNISLNDSNEEYRKIVEKFLKEQKEHEIEHKIINFSLDINDIDIINQERFMNYTPSGSINIDKQKCEENKKSVQHLIKLDKKFKKLLDEHNVHPKSSGVKTSKTNNSTNNKSSYELNVRDLMHITYAKYDDLIKCFERKHKKDTTKKINVPNKENNTKNK